MFAIPNFAKTPPLIMLLFLLQRFDLALNGGGAVTLQFQRSPLQVATRTAYLPWNRIVVVNPVVMTSTGGSADMDMASSGRIGWADQAGHGHDFSLKVSTACVRHK